MREYTSNEIASAKMIIRFFNMQAGTSYKIGSEDKPNSNINVTLTKLDELEWDVSYLKDYIRQYVVDNPASGYQDCILECRREHPQVQADSGVEVSEQQIQYSMGVLEQAVIGLIAKTQTERIESEIMGGVEQKVRDFIREEYGAIERKITTVVDGKKVPMVGIQHEKFETVLKFVANNEPVFLTGPAGSGKNVLCKQVAEALGLKFYFSNAVTQEYKLTGFIDAMGNYQETQFYKAFKHGGVFMFDEMDASIPEVLVILNAAIANRYFDFPNGYVEAHPDFRVIAAGNTIGLGADYEYVGRNQLDAASLDRFALIKIGYSEAIENSVACGDVELAQFCRDFRASAHKAGQSVIVSYRAIERLAKMVQILDTEEALETCLVKGLEKDDINIIVAGIGRRSKYLEALRTIATKI